MARAAVITVTHNSSAVLPAWLQALEDSGLRPELEVCVVDSGSTPDEVAWLRANIEPAVDVLRLEPNLGFGRGCNAGVHATTSPVLVFLNPDAHLIGLSEGLLEPDRTARSIVGAVLHRTAARDDPLPGGFTRLPSARQEAMSLLLGGLTTTYEMTWSPTWISGGSLLATRADFDALGGFDPRIFLFFEDADLCARHTDRGGSVHVDPRFEVEHCGGAGSSHTGHDDALDGLSRLSARDFVARRAGRPELRIALYALLAVWYVPRRVAVRLLRRRPGALTMALDLLWPSRILRRLGAVRFEPR